MQKVSNYQQAIIKNDIEQNSGQIAEVLEKIAANQWTQLSPMQNTVKRLKRKGYRDKADQYIRFEESETHKGVLEQLPVEGPDVEAPASQESINQIVKEGIVGSDDMISSIFLHKGSRVARSVGRISEKITREALGTGFLISSHLIMTNNHVIPDRARAGNCIIEFDFFSDNSGRPIKSNEFELKPEIFFLTSHENEFDYTLVAVEIKNKADEPLNQFGRIQLIEETGKAHIGERLNIIHHPQGKPQHISIRKNLLLTHEESPIYLKYMTDTQPGSSGSPVLNDDWELVALHRASEVINDKNQKELYFQAMYEVDKGIAFELKEKEVSINFGVRISAIANNIKTQRKNFGATKQEFIDEIFTAGEPVSLIAPALPMANMKINQVLDRVNKPYSKAPIHININIADGAIHPGGPSATPLTFNTGPSDERSLRTQLEIFNAKLNTQKSVFRALNFLEDARAQEYLPSDDVMDERRSDYYLDIIHDLDNGGLGREALYNKLHELISGSLQLVKMFPDTTQLESLFQSPGLESMVMLEANGTYTKARAHLYTWVDLQEDRMLRCVYTQALIAPEQLLLKDLIQALKLDVDLPDRFDNNQFLNCEHIVPQSLFGKDPLGVSDLHHLITAEGATNTFRSNRPYRQLGADEGEAGPRGLIHYIDHGGKKLGQFFEPFNNKGLVARATLYFIVAHKGKLAISSYDEEAVKTLIKWSNDEPPGRYERHRNEAIFKVQKNRNPFIDFPKWVDRVDFMQGLRA